MNIALGVVAYYLGRMAGAGLSRSSPPPKPCECQHSWTGTVVTDYPGGEKHQRWCIKCGGTQISYPAC